MGIVSSYTVPGHPIWWIKSCTPPTALESRLDSWRGARICSLHLTRVWVVAQRPRIDCGTLPLAAGVKKNALLPVLIAVTFALGCPKRQTGLRLVYAPPPPSAAGQQNQAEPTQAMVIEEPPPPQPAQSAPVEQVETAPPPKTPAPKIEEPKTSPSPPPEPQRTVEPADAPALVPSIDKTESAGLKERISGLSDHLQAEITRLHQLTLPTAQRKTLRDAQLFLNQATQASQVGDLQRSLQLVKKAGLLVSAVQNP